MRKSKIHELKTHPSAFEAIRLGAKTFEIRVNDRDFQVDDILALYEYWPNSKEYTGDLICKRVSYITPGGEWGLPDDLCVMALAPVL